MLERDDEVIDGMIGLVAGGDMTSGIELMLGEQTPIFRDEAWQEELVQLQGLVDRCRNLCLSGDKKTTTRYLDCWRYLARRARRGSKGTMPDFPKSIEKMFELFDASVRYYAVTYRRRPIAASTNRYISPPKSPILSPRNIRSFINKNELSDEVKTPDELSLSEGLESPQSISDAVVTSELRLIWYLTGEMDIPPFKER